jgi:hypothetical protein
MARPAREFVCLWEFWLLPIAVALLPYRAGLALARWCARTLPLYDETARAGQAQFRAARPRGDARRWLVDFRFAQLIDHADLFWALTRRERSLLSHLDAPPLIGTGPLVVISMHYGQGLWLLPWLRAAGVPVRFLSLRFDAASFDSRLSYLYARLRMRMVERLAGAPVIYTGGARGEIAATLRDGGAVYGLIDVPADSAASANGTFLGAPVYWPPGLVDAAHAAGADVLLLTAHCAPDGRRHVLAERLATTDVAAIASTFGVRIDAAPGAWHFWQFLPAYAAAPVELEAVR